MSKTWAWGVDGALIRHPKQILLGWSGSQETLRLLGFPMVLAGGLREHTENNAMFRPVL